MKKHGILNRDINEALGKLGHTDLICIADCGLPLPDHIKVVDLTIAQGDPSFIKVVNMILKEMVVERLYCAKEIIDHNDYVHTQLIRSIDKIPVEYISHEAFKEQTKKVALIIRTGENTPYANVLLQSGVIF